MTPIDKTLISNLLAQAAENPRLRQNYDLRSSVEDGSQRMLNAVIVIIALIVCVNELKMSHPLVSVIYMALQLAVSLGFIFICPLLATSCGLPLVAWHWIYLAVAFVLLVVAYVLFKKKYYHLHEEYLASLKK